MSQRIIRICCLFVALLVSAGWAATPLVAQTTPTVATDLPDYYPGDTVFIGGSGFGANEDITLQVHRQDDLYPDDIAYQPWTVQADDAGAFLADWLVDEDDLGASFTLTADGASSGAHAETTFTDSPRIGAVTVGAQSNVLCAGTAGSATYAVSIQRTQNGTVNGTMSIAFTAGTPAGVTASLVPLTWTSNGNNPFPPVTLTINTTAATPAGSFAFTVTAKDGTDVSTGGAGTLKVTTGPVATITANSPVCPGSSNTASVPDAGVGATYTWSIVNGSITGGAGTQTITYTSNSNCASTTTLNVTVTSGGCSGPGSKVITVQDTTAPVISASGTTLTLGCNPSAAAINAALGTATASDNCSVGTPTALDSAVTGGCTKSQTRTFNVSDACGNAAAPVTRTVTWTADTTPPVISATGTTLSLGCNPSASDINSALGTATASDNCSVGSPTATDSAVTGGCTKSQTRTWNVSDACGNAAIAVSRTVTWTADTIPPVITATGTTLSLGCNPSASDIDAALGSATASDNCGVGAPTASNSAITGGCSKSQTRTWNVQDNCGNAAATVSRTVTWTADTTPPVISATGTTLSLGCNPSASDIDAALGTATASDNCGVGTPTPSDSAVTGDCTKSQTRTWTVSDNCGNAATSVSRTATWTEDSEAPVITASGTTLTLGCNPTTEEIEAALGTATATDNCSVDTPSASDSAVTGTCSKSQSRSWDVSDACGNPAIAVTRTVTWTVDTEAPVITASGTTLTLGCNPTPEDIEAALGTASATDNCGVAAPTYSDSVVTGDCTKSQTRTWNVSDNCGNAATAVSRTVTWTADTTIPTITTCPPGGFLGSNPATLPTCDSVTALVEASDNCTGPLTASCSSPEDSTTNCLVTRVFNITVTDGCGNESDPCQVTYTWISDTDAPIVTCAADPIDLGCNPATLPTAEDAAGHVVATDGECGAPTILCTANPDSGTCAVTRTFTCTATDISGNVSSASCSVTYIWTSDTTPPEITAIGDSLILGCNPTAEQIDAALGTATATDNCSVGDPIPTTYSVVVSDCVRSQTRSWNVTDACGNPATTVSRTATWTVDLGAPVITATGTTLTLGCNPSAEEIEAALGTATAMDNCSVGNPTPTTDSVVVSNCSRSQTRRWNVADACGQPAVEVSRTVTWTVDTTPPEITATGTTLELGCNPSAADIDAALGTATVTDDCGAVTPTVSDGIVVENGCSRSQTRTWNATDACDNAATPVSRTITWIADTTPPEIMATGTTLDLGCNPTAAEIEAALGSATATDNCGVGTPAATDGAVEEDGCYRSQTRTWNVSDACGNAANTASRTVTWKVDSVLPEITATGTTLTLGCNPTAEQIDAALGTATATDNCDVVDPTATTDNVVVSNCARSQTRTWIVSDACGNPANPVSRTVTWTEDTEAPVITASGTTLSLGCNPTPGEIEAALGTATASDNCGVGMPTISDSAVTGDCAKSQTRSWTVSDNCGNPAEPVSRTVTWKADIAPPTITTCPPGGYLGSNPPTLPTCDSVKAEVVASDNCTDPLTINCSNPEDSITSCLVTRVFTITVTDGCGNESDSCEVIYAWIADTNMPTVTCTADPIDLGCNPAILPTADDAAEQVMATDGNCGSPTVQCVANPDSGTCAVTRRFACTASDNSGNSSVPCDVVYMWTVDTIPPAINAVGTSLALSCNPAASEIDAALGTATATDNCSVGVPTSSDDAVVENGCNRSQTRTWNVTDACGNDAAPVSRTVTWTVDTTPPVITASGTTSMLACNPPVVDIDAALGTATAADNCGVGAPTASDGAVVQNGCSRSQTRTWNVSDNCGNAAVPVSRTVTWTADTTPPVITAIGSSLTLGCRPTQAAIEGALGTATAADNCGVGSPTATDSAVTGDCIKSKTRTWNVTDNCGNPAAPVTRTVTWMLTTTRPVITASGTTLNLGCNPTAAAIDAALGTATASSACGPVTAIASTGSVVVGGCSRCQTRTWTATDGCGNTAIPVSRTVTWKKDTTPPIINCSNDFCHSGNYCGGWGWHWDNDCGDDDDDDHGDSDEPENDHEIVVFAAPGQCSAVVQFNTPNVSDTCSAVSVACTPPSGSSFPVGTTLVTCTATDACGNSSVCTFTVKVKDKERPQMACPADIVVNSDADDCSAVVNYAVPIATDNCSGVSVECNPPSGSTFAKGRTTVRCKAKDASGNKIIREFTVTVRDTVRPVIACPGNITLPCNPNKNVSANYSVTATDNCPCVGLKLSKNSGSNFAVGTTTVTATATDSSGNTSTCSFNVTRAALGFNGFQAPIGGADATGGSYSNTLATFKLGTTIPVKFTASCGGSPLLTGTHTLQATKYSNAVDSDAPIDATPSGNASTGNQFRLASGEWYFNMSTSGCGFSKGTWKLVATMSDGSKHEAWITLKN